MGRCAKDARQPRAQLLDLPAILGPTHNGGRMMVGKNGELFAAIGDLNRDGGPIGNKQSGEIDDTRL